MEFGHSKWKKKSKEKLSEEKQKNEMIKDEGDLKADLEN